MTGNEIREKFLEYFERHGHTRVRSSPLLPANDPTLLFTNAGMNQFKDVFLGIEKREYVRACSSQKCLRAGGKHNDLDEVGKTARHQTFFEMLGNFSFGDYFKEDAIKFAWAFLVDELKMDSSRLWFTVYGGDDEVGPDEDAEKLWEQVGAPRDRILRFGRKDNFWQMGETGPCGPCSEIHYYLGDDPEDPTKNRVDLVNGPGDTTMEIWNLVFMQYNRTEAEPGKYQLEPLPKPSVDTGLGLERTAVIMQGVKSNYETDLLKDIVEFTAKLAGRKYEAETQEGFAMRVIADHARATAFSITDGILPGNEGRNYVIRKIMRRAIYQGRHTLGLEGMFFNKVTNFVVDQMGAAYPELEASREFIEKMVRLEEERFGSTMTVGFQRLDELFTKKGGKLPSYKELASLYDTFGVPRDLIRVSLEERGYAIPEDEFYRKFDEAMRGIHNVGATFTSSVEATAGINAKAALNVEVTATGTPTIDIKISRGPYTLAAQEFGTTEFIGYGTTRLSDSRVLRILKGQVPDIQAVQSLNEGDEGEVVLDRTPFYAESGGQVGDVGRLLNPPADAGGTDLVAAVPGGSGMGVPPVNHAQDARSTLSAVVLDTFSPAQGLIVHKVKVEKGTLKVGDVVRAEVDVEKRDATRRNHTATHLMHAALREVLGTHVKQAGSIVAPNYLRFDFSHYQPLTQSEIEEIERLVNYHILRNEPVQTDEMAVEDAMRSGAMALFGEKYGEKVRVLSIKGAEEIFSKELCGGTHVRATGDIGVFKITSDESIASGVRRIRAVTGVDAYERFREDEEIIGQVTSNLRTSRAELPAMIGRLQDDLKKARREADELRLKIATGAAGSSSSNGDDAREVRGVRVLAREASGLDSAGVRQLSDTLLARIKSGVVVIGRSNDGKASLIVRTSDDLTKKIPAGQVIKELAPIIGGKGGGKADMAEGGGNQPEKLTEALEASYGVIERMLAS
ncbi:MAG: alanyl-tRNA synthetase [Blastocatellia bacterium]|jgi:alanyl-tRNA synthetase|nr:alanyl-tRNA synthetase [Blastocatellia bacterium]